MDYSSWGLKNRIGSKNSCMQVENYVKYMQTKFGGCRFFGFGNFAPVLVNFKMATIWIPLDHGLSMGVKK